MAAMPGAEPDRPLDGIRVVAFTTIIAGPLAAMFLGDFGADVVKVEPRGGDEARRWGRSGFGPDGQFSAMYLAFNRNQRSVVLDLKSAEGLDHALRLVEGADVVIESFKPGVAARLGVGYDRVSELNPRVVYCSVSGYGQTGPLRDRPGFDTLMQAYAGHMSITGEEGRGSVRIGPSAIDITTGAHAALGIMLALWERERSGRGQLVDVSLYDTALHLVSNVIADYTGSGEEPRRTGGFYPFAAPYGVFEASDRELFVGISNDRRWVEFCRAAGLDELVADERFVTSAARIENRETLNALMAGLFETRTAGEWIALCDEAGVPAGLIESIPEVVGQEQAAARGMIVDTGVGGARTAGIPIRLSRTPGAVRRAAPRLGD
jgi:crotonobetainyl-CoA:carnitine CoA-transferase CaiB-like acyl-CoA transferase